uniref:Uncharacterized protein n=1 Tax=Siphoviridae sp. ctCS019 TaxID=2825378 RepID=A0A8S5U5C9_9CAUD|nr:MAG TPA: hypothetical protein [Siphoviridae sp. ctCS019]
MKIDLTGCSKKRAPRFLFFPPYPLFLILKPLYNIYRVYNRVRARHARARGRFCLSKTAYLKH